MDFSRRNIIKIIVILYISNLLFFTVCFSHQNIPAITLQSEISTWYNSAVQIKASDADSAYVYFRKIIEIDSIENTENRLQEDSIVEMIIESKLFIANYLSNKYTPDKSIEEYEKLNKYLESKLTHLQQNLFKKANSIHVHNDIKIALIYMNSGKIDSARDFLNDAIDRSKSADDTSNLCNAYRNMGVIDYYTGDYVKANEHFFVALDLAEKANLKYLQARITSNIGAVNQKQGNLETALKYNFKSVEIRKELNDSVGLASVYNNIGNIYRHQKKYNKAIDIFQKSLEIKKKYKKTRGIAITYTNLANIYTEKQDFDQAIGLYKKAYEEFEKINATIELCSVIGNISKLYIDSGYLELGVKYAKKQLTLAKENGLLPQQKLAAENLSEVYSKLNKFDKAVIYLKLQKTIADSLYGIEKNKAIIELETKYESEKKQKEIELLSRQNTITSLKVKQRGLIIIILASFCLLIIIAGISIILYRQFKQKQALKQLEVEEAKLRTKAIIETQEKERRVIARDLHDGIGQLLASTSMYFGNLSNELASIAPTKFEDFKKSVNILNDACNELRLISHQMMPKTLLDLGLIAALEDLLEITLKQNKIAYSFEHFGIEMRLPSDIEVVIFRISQELIQNILKHSKANEVSVQLYVTGNLLILNIEDDGIGIDKDKISEGIGLRNIISRADMINGTLLIENSPNKGTIAIVKVPLKKMSN